MRRCADGAVSSRRSLTADHSARVARHIASRHGTGTGRVEPGESLNRVRKGASPAVLVGGCSQSSYTAGSL